MIRRIALVTAALLLALVLGSAALVAAWVAGVRVPIASGARYMKVEKLAVADATAGTPQETFYVALIGNDARSGRGPARGDALHLVGVNPQANTASMLNFPRDTCWRGGKINRAHNDGPRAQANALGELVGVPVSYVISVNFEEFQRLVDDMGGLQIDVPTPMDDHYSGAVFSAGPHRMTGTQALAFSRDRHDFPSGDIQRSTNQGLVILAGLRQLQAEAKGPLGEFKAAAALARHTQLDGMGVTEIWRLGRVAHRLDPAAVKSVTIPTGGGGGCLGLGAGAGALFADFADDATLQAH